MLLEPIGEMAERRDDPIRLHTRAVDRIRPELPRPHKHGFHADSVRADDVAFEVVADHPRHVRVRVERLACRFEVRRAWLAEHGRLHLGGFAAADHQVGAVAPLAEKGIAAQREVRVGLGQGGHGTTAVVVLGGADEFVEGWTDHITVTTVGEASRVLEASRVFRLTSPVWLISSGGSSNSPERTDASSVTMRDELVRLGVPPERILLESTSRNTYDEAVLIAPMLRSHAVQQLVLVTSDTHMRRALGAFRAAGWNAVPAIAPHPKAPLGWVWWMLPTVFGLELSSEVTHELLGIPYYWVRGRWRS